MKDEKALLFLKFLKELPEDTTHLFLLGDIFDMWVCDHQFYETEFQPIIKEFQRLTRLPLQIHYFEGNHDFHLESFWRERLGIQVHPGPGYFNLGELRLRVEHGDECNPDDKNYLKLRRFLRLPLTKMVIQSAPGALVKLVGENWSQWSRQSRPYVNEKVKMRARQYAIEALSKKEFDIILFGHIHMRDQFQFEFNGKHFEYVNLGSWLDEPAVYELTPQSRRFVAIS